MTTATIDRTAYPFESHWMAGAGHWPHEEAPDVAIRSLGEFLSSKIVT